MKLKRWIVGSAILLICSISVATIIPFVLIKNKTNSSNNPAPQPQPQPNHNEAQVMVEQEVSSINNQNITLINPNITTSQLEAISAGNIIDKLNINLANGDFEYNIDPSSFSKKNGQIKFKILVSCYAGPNQEDYYELETKEIIVPYTLTAQNNSLVNQAINELNNLQLQWNMNKMQGNKFRFLSPKAFSNYYLLNYLSNLDPIDLDRKYNILLNIPEDSFNIDILNYVVRFKIEVRNKNNSNNKGLTIEKRMEYTPQNVDISELDRLPVDPSIRIQNSYKGKLEKLGQLEYKTLSNIEPEFDAMDKDWKIKEMLYQLRFTFYQTFSDNASSIDYGIITNTSNNVVLELRAIIKNTVTIAPFIQGCSETIANQELRTGDIISIKTAFNHSGKWILMSGGEVLPGMSDGFSFAQGNRQQIEQASRHDIYLANMQSLNIQVRKQNNQIYSTNINLRRFSFLFPFLNTRN